MPHRRRLRSASTEQLDFPTCRRSTIEGRAFPVAGAKVWNGLQSDVTSASSLSVFKNRLKTYLFRRCYETVWLWITFLFPSHYLPSRKVILAIVFTVLATLKMSTMMMMINVTLGSISLVITTITVHHISLSRLSLENLCTCTFLKKDLKFDLRFARHITEWHRVARSLCDSWALCFPTLCVNSAITSVIHLYHLHSQSTTLIVRGDERTARVCSVPDLSARRPWAGSLLFRRPTHPQML